MADELKGKALLFGVLALQNSFLSREQLLAAVDRWLADKSQSLEELIVSAAALPKEVVELLRGLTRIHLQHHDDRVDQSLASISSVDSIAEEIRQRGDTELNDSVSLVPPHRNSPQPNAAPAPSPSPGHPNAAPRFRIIRPHAKGGLGEVFLATDTELNREVALKEIQARYADSPESRTRFVIEAEITGGLEHPGIVPVYGLGQYDSGRPFYAMRFIRGDSLREAVDLFHRQVERKDTAVTRPIKKPSSTVEEPTSSSAPSPPTPLDPSLPSSAFQATFEVQPVAANSPPNDTVPCVSKSAYASLEFRQLLGRFIDVCNAIEYAHSRGVLHRDLKPGNIMLGKYGETLVVDWGLAKAKGRDAAASPLDERTLLPSSGSGSAATQTGSIVGTPAFMSPEQAAGRLNELGSPSDVYSLGATLYYVLTGIAPFKAPSISEVLLKVQTGRFQPPISVNVNIPPSLNAICLRAMALAPNQRYSTPRTLADDIERFLADEPIQSYAEPALQRTRRWMRKHPRSVAGLAASLIVGIVSTLAIATVVSQTNRQLSNKNEELTQANTRESLARESAVANEKLAREQSQLALSTLTSVIQDIQGGLKSLPGGSEIRRRLLVTSLDKLQDVSTSLVTQTTVDRNTMLALSELGDVVLQFGGDPNIDTNAAGELPTLIAEQKSAVELAQTLLTRAHEIAVELANDSPNNEQAQRDLANTLDRLGTVQWRLGESTQALEYYNQAIEIYDSIATKYESNAAFQRALALAHDKIGDMQLQQGRVTESLERYRQALSLRTRLLTATPDNPTFADDLADSHLNIGNVQKRMGDLTEALESYNLCLARRTESAESSPQDRSTQSDLAEIQTRIGETQRQLGQITESIATLTQCLEIRSKLARTDPNDITAQSQLAATHQVVGELYRQQGDLSKTRESFERSLEVRRRLVESDPSDRIFQRELASTYQVLGELELQSGDISAATTAYRECVELRIKLADTDADDAEARRDLAIAYAKIGELQIQEGDYNAALEAFEACFEHSQSLAELDPSDTRARRELAVAHDHLGLALRRLNRPSDALEHYESSLAIRETLGQESPEDPFTRRDISISLESIGAVYQESGRFRESLPLYERCLEIRVSLAQTDSTNALAMRDLSFLHISMGTAWLRLGNVDKAIASFEESLKIRRALADADPADARAQRDVANLMLNIGFTHTRAGQFEQSIKPYSECIEIQKRLSEQDPNDVQLRRDLATSYHYLGHAQMELERYSDAAVSGRAGIETIEGLIAVGVTDRATQEQLSFFEGVTAIAEEAALVLGPLEKLLEQPADELPDLLERRGIELVGRRRLDQLAPTAAALVECPNATETNLYNAACFFSLSAASIKPAPGQTLTEEQTLQRNTQIEQAIDTLKKAIAAGFNDKNQIRRDPDLSILKDSPEFQALLSDDESADDDPGSNP